MSGARRLWDSALSLVNTVATVGSAFVTYRLVSRHLGVNSFGLWALTGAALFPLRFADLSINSAVLRYLGVARGTGLRRVIRSVVLSALATNIAAFVLFLAISAFVTPLIIHRTVAPAQWPAAFALLPFLIAASMAQLIAGVFSNAVLGLHRYRTVYVVGIAIAVLQVALIFAAIGRFGIAGYAILQALLYAVQAVVFGVLLLLHREDRESLEAAQFRLRHFMSFAFKLNVNAILATMVEPLAKLLLGRFGTLAIVGMYEIVSRIYQQVRAVMVAPMQPFAIAMIRDLHVDRDAFRRTYEVSLLYSIMVALLLLASIVPAAIFFRLLMGFADPVLPLIVACVAVSMSCAIVAVPAYNASIAANDVRPIIASTVIFLVVLALIGFVLGGATGASGVLLGVVVANVLAACALVLLSGRLLGFAGMPPPRLLLAHAAIAWRRIRAAPLLLRGLARANRPPPG